MNFAPSFHFLKNFMEISTSHDFPFSEISHYYYLSASAAFHACLLRVSQRTVCRTSSLKIPSLKGHRVHAELVANRCGWTGREVDTYINRRINRCVVEKSPRLKSLFPVAHVPDFMRFFTCHRTICFPRWIYYVAIVADPILQLSLTTGYLVPASSRPIS